MQQLIKRLFWVALLGLSQQGVWAFSLGGPIGNNPNPNGAAGDVGDAWQTPSIAYGLGGDLNAPKNIGEGYRRNVSVLYYAADASFLDYFGSNGVAAVDGAFAILNRTFTNDPVTGQYLAHGVDSYNLSDFPLETRHLNYQAQALGLFDLKSYVLVAMTEQLGLADPVRYNWTLHNRFGTPCPAGIGYEVVQRNFDIVSTPLNQLEYTPYINDVLYSYYIVEFCTGVPLAETVPFSVDPLADTYSPVAAGQSILLTYGGYLTGLTRDDVAGLHYLVTSNNVDTEVPPADTLLQSTNLNTPQLLYTANLGALLSASVTNSAAALQALFPGLVVASSHFYFTVGTNFIVTSYFTNYIGSPIGSPPVLVRVTNQVIVPETNYLNTFANVVVTTNFFKNSYLSNTAAYLTTTTIGPLIGAPIGSPEVTNTSSHGILLTNVPTGDYYLIPAGSCGFNFPNQPHGYPIAVVTATTNLITSAFTTNAAGQIYGYSQSLVIYSTNHIFVVYPCTFTTSPNGLYQGIQRMQFINADYDSLIGQYFQPITNTITMVLVTNSQPVTLTFQRVITTPDFLFAAGDLGGGAGAVPVFDRNLTFNQTTALPGLAGPGVIEPPTTFTWDKIGPVYFNYATLLTGTPYFTESPGNDGIDSYYAAYFVWASFDGTTNDPVVYPDGMNLQNLESQIYVQIAPSSLPNGTNGVAYGPVTFSATGGAFDYSSVTWSVAGLPITPLSTLPSGMTLSSTGTLSGAPTQSGVFDFIVVMTDALGRSVQWYYSITIQ